MKNNRKYRTLKMQRGIAILAALIFIALFSALSVGMLSMASANLQVSSNHQKSNMALNAALSGLECARYITATTPAVSTGLNYVTDTQANTVWINLYNRLQGAYLGSQAVGAIQTFTDAGGAGTQILTGLIPYQDNGAAFQIRFYRYNSDPRRLYLECRGQHGGIERTVQMELSITKDAQVLNYALAGRGRLWLAGDTTIHGDIYSSWDVASISPFNMTDDSTVEGSVNTILPWQDLLDESYQMQSLAYDGSGNLILNDNQSVNSSGHLLSADGQVVTNSSGSPIDIMGMDFQNVEGQYNIALDGSGNPVQGYIDGQPIGPVMYGNPVEAFDGDGNRIYGSGDELQGTYENANYSQPDQSNIPGLNISEYNTACYVDGTVNYIPTTTVSAAGSVIQNGKISTSGVTTRMEYFPHAAGSYTTRASSSSLSLTRYVYENKTIRNVRIGGGTNALFKNCTFENVLYVDCSTSGPTSTTSTYNNIRFENCTFNGTIVTNVPQNLNSGWWMRNNLYFTGEAAFNNTSTFQEATILAPHFNVNLGNTNPTVSENNVLTGAIVGGIVDVRGNAQIYGTIIAMADTTAYPSGYVNNIGATEADGGSETTEAGDIGVIEITPAEENMLPSGITSPILLKPLKNTYEEKI